MSNFVPSGPGSFALKFCAVAALASLMAGCASDSTRLSDPFSNPFSTSSNEPVRHMASNTIPAGRSPPIVSQALPAHGSSMASAAPLRPQVMTAYNAPISHETTGSIEQGSARTAPGASYGGWTSGGGVPVIVGEGESVDVLSKRYGVPPNALLQTNGLRSASEVRPGTHLTIPVYNAVASRHDAPQVAQAEPVRSERPLDRAALRKQRAAERQQALAPPARSVASARPVAPARMAAKVTPRTIQPAPTRELARNEPPVTRGQTLPQAKASAKAAPVRTAALAPATVAPIKAAPVQAAPKQPDPAPTANVAAAAPVADASGNPEFRWPARGRIIQGFKGGNDGINIAVPEGTAVKAAETGTVAYAGSELKGYGNLVLIRHPNGFVTAYANNGELDVKRGDQVKRGQTIAKSGQSGNVASPQLHFELRKGSTPVDPTSYLAGL